MRQASANIAGQARSKHARVPPRVTNARAAFFFGAPFYCAPCRFGRQSVAPKKLGYAAGKLVVYRNLRFRLRARGMERRSLAQDAQMPLQL